MTRSKLQKRGTKRFFRVAPRTCRCASTPSLACLVLLSGSPRQCKNFLKATSTFLPALCCAGDPGDLNRLATRLVEMAASIDQSTPDSRRSASFASSARLCAFRRARPRVPSAPAGRLRARPGCFLCARRRAAPAQIVMISAARTKAGIARRNEHGLTRWSTLFDRDNSDFDKPNGLPIERFAALLAARVRPRSPRCGRAGELSGVGVIWQRAEQPPCRRERGRPRHRLRDLCGTNPVVSEGSSSSPACTTASTSGVFRRPSSSWDSLACLRDRQRHRVHPQAASGAAGGWSLRPAPTPPTHR